jgi:hypothetical protein
MENNNILTSTDTTTMFNNDATRRCVDMLAQLLEAQRKAMEFLINESLDDSLEGEAIAMGMGDAIKAFDGILPEGVYEVAINCERD